MYVTEPFSDVIDRAEGTLASPDNVYERRLGDMADMYEDAEAAQAVGNPVIYKVYEKKIPGLAGELQWCMSVTMPGKIGREYYMTKGHFHVATNAAEVYLGLEGEGYLLMQTEKGDVQVLEMERGTIAYVPPGWAHRSVNTGRGPFVFYAVWPAHAGHDYGTIEESGFAKLVMERDGQSRVVPHP